MHPNAKKLHSATDKLNEAILAYENRLVSLNLGTRAEVELDKDTYLVFGRDGERFRLLIYLRDGGSVPLLKVSRELRLRAVEMMPALETDLFDAFRIEIGRVENATDSVLQMAERLKQLRDPS